MVGVHGYLKRGDRKSPLGPPTVEGWMRGLSVSDAASLAVSIAESEEPTNRRVARQYEIALWRRNENP
jgi:hypothetical protein